VGKVIYWPLKVLSYLLLSAGILIWGGAGLWGFFIELAIVNQAAGFWGVVIGIFILPVTLFAAPFYALVAQGTWFPLILIYGGGFTGLCLFGAGSFIKEKLEELEFDEELDKFPSNLKQKVCLWIGIIAFVGIILFHWGVPLFFKTNIKFFSHSYKRQFEAFKSSIELRNEAMNIINPPSSLTGTGMYSIKSDNHSKARELLKKSLSVSKQVSDEFLDSLAPELSIHYHKEFQKGLKMYLESSDPNNLDFEKQLKSQRLMMKFGEWYRKEFKK